MRHVTFYKILACSLTLASVASAASAEAPKSDINALIKALQDQSQRLAEHEKKLLEQQKAMEEQQRTLAQERIQFERLQTDVIAMTGKPIPGMAAKGTATAKAQTNAPQEVGTERKQSSEKPPEIAAIIEEGGVLLQKGKAVVTPGVEYTHSSATRVSIEGFSIIPSVNIGLFDISRVNRDTISPSLSLRYGLTNRFEIEGKIPYVYRVDATNTRPIGIANAPETLTTVTSHGLGDIEAGAHYQINKGQGGWPYFIANLRVKSNTGTSPFEVPVVSGVQTELPTGSGFWAFQPSVTMIYPSDPVVFYSNFGYLHSIGRSFPIYGDIQPGDGISGSSGMSVSLNDKTSFSVGYSHTTVMKTLQNSSNVPNSPILQIGALDFGYSYALNDTTNINATVSAGVTEDAPDVRFIFRVPMTFDLN